MWTLHSTLDLGFWISVLEVQPDAAARTMLVPYTTLFLYTSCCTLGLYSKIQFCQVKLYMCKHAYYELVEVEDFNFSVQTCSVIKVLICKHYKKKKNYNSVLWLDFYDLTRLYTKECRLLLIKLVKTWHGRYKRWTLNCNKHTYTYIYTYIRRSENRFHVENYKKQLFK